MNELVKMANTTRRTPSQSGELVQPLPAAPFVRGLQLKANCMIHTIAVLQYTGS